MSQVMLNVRTHISPNEIIYCEADENYTRIHYSNRMEIVPVTLKTVEKRLEEYPFFRIHKSYLVNLQHILEKKEKYEVEMLNNRSLTVSRRKAVEFKRLLKRNQKI